MYNGNMDTVDRDFAKKVMSRLDKLDDDEKDFIILGMALEIVETDDKKQFLKMLEELRNSQATEAMALIRMDSHLEDLITKRSDRQKKRREKIAFTGQFMLADIFSSFTKQEMVSFARGMHLYSINQGFKVADMRERLANDMLESDILYRLFADIPMRRSQYLKRLLRRGDHWGFRSVTMT